MKKLRIKESSVTFADIFFIHSASGRSYKLVPVSILCGGIEADGAKFVCAIGSCPDDLRKEIRFSTTTPSETICRAIEFFKDQDAIDPISAVGIGSFGPIDLKRDSPTYGYITSKPKQNCARKQVF